MELCAASGVSGQFFFLRDNRYYEADVKALLQNAWPEMNYWDHASWDLNYRRLAVSGFVTMPEWATAEHPQPNADFTRYLYYRDGALLVYKPDKDSQTADHVVGTPDVPEPVLAAAKAAVQKAYQDYKNGGYDSGADLDDWRVEYVAEDWYRAYPNGTLIAYNLNYEYHAQKPANVTLAGGAYVDEDGWLMPDYPYCHYLFFTETDGQYTFLEEWMLNDGGPGSKVFDAEMQRWAVELGLSSVSDATPEELLLQLYDGKGGRFLTQLSGMSEAERQLVCQKLDKILQHGTAEQQSLYMDAVQSLSWCAYSFNDAQQQAYDYFLEYSARSAQAAPAGPADHGRAGVGGDDHAGIPGKRLREHPHTGPKPRRDVPAGRRLFRQLFLGGGRPHRGRCSAGAEADPVLPERRHHRYRLGALPAGILRISGPNLRLSGSRHRHRL